LGISNDERFAARVGAQGIGIVVTGNAFAGGIELEFATELPTDGRGVTGVFAVPGDRGIAGGVRMGAGVRRWDVIFV